MQTYIILQRNTLKARHISFYIFLLQKNASRNITWVRIYIFHKHHESMPSKPAFPPRRHHKSMLQPLSLYLLSKRCCMSLYLSKKGPIKTRSLHNGLVYLPQSTLKHTPEGLSAWRSLYVLAKRHFQGTPLPSRSTSAKYWRLKHNYLASI